MAIMFITKSGAALLDAFDYHECEIAIYLRIDRQTFLPPPGEENLFFFELTKGGETYNDSFTSYKTYEHAREAALTLAEELG
jgi:hypothetical protein